MVGLSKNQLKQLPKNIIGITRTNNAQELAEIYTTANVFCNPTLEEVMGLTNLEA
jgi:putative colanic acid biosynthesis glycosyltransferase